MAITPQLMQNKEVVVGKTAKSRGVLIENKIDYLESLAGKVSRKSRKWLNDQMLIKLVPRLNAEEIRGLFSPPPWGEDVPASPFCMTNVGVWDTFRNIDMDKEVTIMDVLETSCTKGKRQVDSDKEAVLNSWYRIENRTREALQRSNLTELIDNYETCIRAFLMEDLDKSELVLEVQDPFHRLLLHGVCEFYNLVSVTVQKTDEKGLLKMTEIKKKKTALELPNFTLCHFLKMSKEETDQ